MNPWELHFQLVDIKEIRIGTNAEKASMSMLFLVQNL
jgi:hypothetical protein